MFTYIYMYMYIQIYISNTRTLTHLFVYKTLQMLYGGTLLLARTGHLHARVQI